MPFTEADLAKADVVISLYPQVDSSGRGLLIKFLLFDGHYEIVFIPSGLVGSISNRLKASKGYLEKSSQTAANQERELFLAKQPSFTAEDQDALSRTVDNCEIHIFKNAVALLLHRSGGDDLRIAMGPVVTQHMQDYLESAQPDLIGPDDADTSKPN